MGCDRGSNSIAGASGFERTLNPLATFPPQFKIRLGHPVDNGGLRALAIAPRAYCGGLNLIGRPALQERRREARDAVAAAAEEREYEGHRAKSPGTNKRGTYEPLCRSAIPVLASGHQEGLTRPHPWLLRVRKSAARMRASAL